SILTPVKATTAEPATRRSAGRRQRNGRSNNEGNWSSSEHANLPCSGALQPKSLFGCATLVLAEPRWLVLCVGCRGNRKEIPDSPPGFLDSCRAIPKPPASKADTQDFYSTRFLCWSLRLGNSCSLYNFGQLRTFVVARNDH